jgi:hypothetical protein
MPSQPDDEDKLTDAKKDILDDVIATVAEAARTHGVKEWILRAQLKGRGPRSSHPVHGKRLDNDWELGLLLNLKKMDDIGFPLQPEAIAANANMILQRNHCGHASRPKPVSEKWVRRFLKRHKEHEFVLCLQESLEIGRFQANKQEVIRTYFKKLFAALAKYRIDPADCYNMDETGFRIGVGGKKRVVTRNARRRAFAPSSTNSDYVTVVECVSAGRNAIPPLVILPGKNFMESWVINTDMPEDFSLAVSDSGYTNDQLCLQWLKHFERESARQQVGEYRMLILDGYGSHLTLDFISFCEEHKIVPFRLPPHTTHMLQPLDVVLFCSYKKEHRNVLHKAMFSCCANFNKIEFLHALKGMREKAFRQTSVASAFRKTGIFPFRPDVVLQQLPDYRPTTPGWWKEFVEEESSSSCATTPRAWSPSATQQVSEVNHFTSTFPPPGYTTPEPPTPEPFSPFALVPQRPTQEVPISYSNSLEPSTPYSSSPSSQPSTPTSARALKRYAERIERHEMNSPVRKLIAPFLEGAVGIATSEMIAYKQLAIRTDAQHERAKRQTRSRKILHSEGGVVTVTDALRRVAAQREEEERKNNAEERKKATERTREERERKKAETKEQNRIQRERIREEKKREREEEKAQEKLRRAEERANKRSRKE